MMMMTMMMTFMKHGEMTDADKAMNVPFVGRRGSYGSRRYGARVNSRPMRIGWASDEQPSFQKHWPADQLFSEVLFG